MEVAQVIDRVTHAIIGGMEAESMGIADDPAFYHMLSSTLYSDEKKAVVRETLCNAWDAHIEAGCTDRPLEISLSADTLSIKDFGLGIPRELIRPIYGVYGSSTKKKNAAVTGGFGLGCKAPFAYVDHFEVVSCHQGEKTIYRMSKSSGEVLGKPSIQPIVSVPTTETGITVSMMIKYMDRDRFEDLIRKVAMQGGMKVNFNGKNIEPMPFDKAKHGYLIMPCKNISQNTAIKVFARYGNVIYPIETNNAYSSSYNVILRFLGKFESGTHYDRNSNPWAIVLQVQPNTISVTPSRESLSMSAHTIETLTNLLNKFDDSILDTVELRQECFTLAKQAIHDENLNPIQLLTLEQKLTNRDAVETKTIEYIGNIKDAAGHILRNSYPSWSGFNKRIQEERFKALLNKGYGPRGLMQSYRAERNKINGAKRGRRPYSTWFEKRLVWPVLEGLKKQPLLTAKNFGVWCSMGNSKAHRAYNIDGFVQINDYFRPALDELLKFTRGTVIIGYSRLSIADRGGNVEGMQEKWGHLTDSLCYIVSRSPTKVAAAVKFFTGLGLNVIDTTAHNKYDDEPEVVEARRAARAAREPAPKKPKRIGYPALSNLKMLDNIKDLYADEGICLPKPEFVAVVSPMLNKVKELDSRYINTRTEIEAVLRLYGSRGVGVPSSVQVVKAKAEGAMDIIPFLIQETMKAFQTMPELKTYFENRVNTRLGESLMLNDKESCIFHYIVGDDILRKKYKLSEPLTQKFRDHITIAEALLYHRPKDPERIELRNLIWSWKPNAVTLELVKKFQQNDLVECLSKEFLNNHAWRLNEKSRKIYRGIILTILNKGK